MKRSLWLMSALLSVSVNVQAQAIYRWIDSSGVVHYTDVPVPDADKLNAGKFAGEPQPEASLPYETRRAMLNFPATLYIGGGCGELCVTARTFLQKRGIPFAERTLRSKEEIAAFTKLTGKNIVPSLAVGRTFLSGYEATLWNNELDIAGYPKTAPYRPVTVAPSKFEHAVNSPFPSVPAASAVPEISETP
ncbi:MAG: glutaredoxin family protein [Gallionella sp.]